MFSNKLWNMDTPVLASQQKLIKFISFVQTVDAI